MSVPTLQNGPWVFNVNNTFTDATYTNVTRWALWKVKDVLASFTEWSVIASTNGTDLANIGAGGDIDYWDAYTDAVTNSWVILENSVTGEQLCIYNSNANSQMINIYWSVTGGFGADGTTSAVPTVTEATDLVSTSGYFTGVSGSLDGVSVSGMISADGKCTRIYVRQRHSGTYFAGQLILLEELLNTPAQWISTHKRCAMLMDIARFSETGTAQSPLMSYADGEIWDCYIEDATPTEAHHLVYAMGECYGTGIYNKTAPIVSNVSTALGWVTGAIASPISIFKSGSTYGGYCGCLQDIFWAPRHHNSLDCYPSDSSRAWIKFGCFLVPWNGDAPTEALELV